MVRSNKRWLRVLLAAVLLFGFVPGGMADSGRASGNRDKAHYDVSIPSQDAAQALTKLAEQTEALFLFPYDIAESRTANAVSGNYTIMEALEIMLQDSGLAAGLSEKGVIKIYLVDNDKPKDRERVEVKPSKKGLIATLISLFSTASVSALAAEETKPVEPTLSMDEIIVTAQKRGEQSLVDVPFSVTSVNEEQIKAGSFTDFDELAVTIPGLTSINADGSPGKRKFQIRGVSADVGARATVGYYWDEVPVNVDLFTAPDGSLLDVNRVEVLRGPQGTIFGESSMGGTIRIINNKPDLSEFGGEVSLGVAHTKNGDVSWNAGTVLNVPIVEDKFGVRLAAKFDDIGGYIDNPLTSRDDVNSIEKSQIRLKTLWAPTEELNVEFTYYRDRTDYKGRSVVTNLDDFEFASTGEESGPSDFDLFDLTIEYDLGFANLVSATSHIKGSQTQPFAIEQNPFSGTTTRNELDFNTTTSELRLSSKGDSRLFWTIGGIYSDKDFDAFLDSQFRILGPTAPNPVFDLFGLTPGFSSVSIGLSGSTILRSESWAVFGEIGYEFTERLTVSLGMRYYDVDYEGENGIRTETSITFLDPDLNLRTDNGLWALGGITNPLVNPPVVDSATPSGSDDAFSPRLNVSYALNDDANAYFSVAKGFRSGGVNQVLSTVNTLTGGQIEFEPSYASETLWTYELGFKAYLDDARWLVEAAVFYTDWKDIQTNVIPVGSNVGTTVNGDEAEIYGFDANLVFKATEVLTLGVSLNYTHHEYNLTDEFVMAGTPEERNLGFIDGDPLPNVPDWSGSAYISWRPQLSDSLTGLVHLVYSYQDETAIATRLDPVDPFLTMDSLSLVNLRLGLEGDQWGAYLYAVNLFDEGGLAAPSSLSRAAQFGGPVIKPRTVGLEFRRSF